MATTSSPKVVSRNALEISSQGLVFVNQRTIRYSQKIRFRDNRDRIEAFISGKERKEEIYLKIINSQTTYHNDENFLNMRKSFPHQWMYLFENLSTSLFNVPESEVFSVGIIRQYDVDENTHSKQHLQLVFKSALQRSPRPKRIVARLLTNKNHWQLVILDLQKGIEKPELYIINSTNKAKVLSLEEIQDEYFYIIGESLNEVFSDMHTRGRIIPSEIKYIQRLQYGIGGCAFAINSNHLWFLRKYNKDIDQFCFKKGDVKIKTFIKKIPIFIGENENQKVEYVELKKKEIDKEASRDKSHRYTLIDEITQRIKFYIEILKKHQLKNELASFNPKSLRKIS